MYGQGGSFNPHYRHGVPPPQHQPGATGSFPQQPIAPPPAPYPQHPGMRPPPGPYQHGMPPPQNQPFPFAQQQRGYAPMPMPPQQGGYAPMPMSGPPPPQQTIYQAPPQYPMPGSLPPPPPRPPSFAPENALLPSGLPPPPPPPPRSPPPPPPLSSEPPTSVVSQAWNAEAGGKQEGGDGGRDAKTLKADTQLIVSDDSDMDMDGDDDSPLRQPLTPENSSLVTAECTGDINVSHSVGDISSLGKDLPAGSGDNVKTAHVTVDGGGSPFRLIQGYASDDSANEVDAVPGGASTLSILPEDNKHNHPNDRNTGIGYQKHATAKENVNSSPGTEQNGEAEKYHLKDESNPVKHDTDVLGHLAIEDLSDSEFDGGQRNESYERRQRKRTRSQSPQDRSRSPLGPNKGSASQSSSPGKQSRPPFAKRVHQDGEGNSGDRIAQQGDLVLTEKFVSSSNDLIGKGGDNATPDGALGQHCHGDNLTSEPSQPVAASANASDPHKLQSPCLPLESQSVLNMSSSAGDEITVGQSAAGAPFAVQTNKNSMACDHLQPRPCPPEHMSSSNMIRLPGQPLFATSEFPQAQFQHNVIAPANDFMQNQTRSYPPPDISHPRPLDFHHHTHPPAVSSHQQPSAISVENAPVPPPDRWSEYSGSVGLSYASHHLPYSQHQPPGNLDSGTNLIYPSFPRFSSNLPGSSDLGPLSDVDLPKSSIKPHYNPFASTFEQTDPNLDIGPVVSPNAVDSISTKAEHMNALSPFGQSFPESRSYAHESSAEAVPSKQKPFRQEFASGAPYDPLLDSIEPSSSSINKVDPSKEKNRSAESRAASKHMNIEVDSENMYGLGVVAESEVEGLGEVAADTEAGVVENASPEFLGAKDWNSDIPGDIDNDQTLDKNKTAKDSRSMKLFKTAIADFVKEVLKPSWRQGNMSKEAFKTIVRKTVDKVSNSVPSSHIPKTPAKIKHYVQSSQRKVTKLVMGYVDKYAKL